MIKISLLSQNKEEKRIFTEPIDLDHIGYSIFFNNIY